VAHAQAAGRAAAQRAAAAPQAPTLTFPIAQPCEPIRPPQRQAGRPTPQQAAAAAAMPPIGTPAGDSARDAARQREERARGGTGFPNQSVRALAAPGVMGNGILGGVCMTAHDSVVQQIAGRLDFNSFKGHLMGLSQFGDRWAGNPIGPGNQAAVEWIEAQLRSWGYVPVRMKYTFEGQPREQVYATKVGTRFPGEMYLIGAHMDGRGGGAAINDDGSGTALVMEIARVMASPDIQTARSVRFALWNNEETGLNGARAYVEQRQLLQGIETPQGSGRYDEPRWLGMIQHDMLLYDHGNPPMAFQSFNADVNVEFQLNSLKAAESAQLGLLLINSNRLFATEYPAQLSNSMSNTDTGAFQDIIPSVSLREGRRLYEMGRGSNPTYHQPTDIYATFTDQDYRLGFNAVQTTFGAVAKLTEANIVPKS
jgi:hypothetical protein